MEIELNTSPWTDSEDACLKEYWKTCDPWDVHDMLTAINPPARSWPSIKKRARMLGLGKHKIPSE